MINPLMQFGGCAERGGRYRKRFMGFWYVAVWIFPCLRVICRSKNVMDVEGVSVFHWRVPKLFRVLLNSTHWLLGVDMFVLVGRSVQIAKMSLIYRL